MAMAQTAGVDGILQAAALRQLQHDAIHHARRRAQAARAESDKQKAAAVRKDNCQRARDQMATLDSGQRIARIKADGEREILDDDARAKEAKRTRDIIATECRAGS